MSKIIKAYYKHSKLYPDVIVVDEAPAIKDCYSVQIREGIGYFNKIMCRGKLEAIQYAKEELKLP